MSKHYLNIFTQRNSAILLLLGFASGLPLALTSGTLQAWMTVENIDLKTIGIFSLVGQAYVFKFLWSPFMDRYTPPFLGRRRGWLLQLALGDTSPPAPRSRPARLARGPGHPGTLCLLTLRLNLPRTPPDIHFPLHHPVLLNNRL